MSTTAVRPQPPRAAASSLALSLPSRLVAGFSGGPGVVLKLVLLALVNALGIWASAVLIDHRRWPALGVLVAATAAIDAIYLLPRKTVPAKFLLPATIFLLAFQIIPIVYTVEVGFTNYSTGHVAVKSEAIDAIEQNSLEESGKSYTMAPARDSDGQLVLVLVDEDGGKTYAGTRDGLEPIPRSDVRLSPDGLIVAAKGYELVKGAGLFRLDKELSAFTVPTQGNAAIRAEGLETALELRPTLRYDEKRGAFVRISNGAVFRDNGRGSFVSASREDLEPGWRTNVGFRNFSRVLHDPLIRQPFLRVFGWTLVFATLTVALSFGLGLFLAIALNRPGMRFLRTYRSLLVIPWAVPSFLSILVWAGLLNDDFGVVNRILHANIPWLFDPQWAKVSILLVSLWLSFPYFFLVALGALQSIPAELVEAARVDGAGAWQVFRRITLPLLVVVVAPLLIASFAYNFNNFNTIYLLTGGGPDANDQSIAGSTDILISYTYKLAFESGKGQDYGLASAISMFIFLIVGTISAISFWRTRALENVR